MFMKYGRPAPTPMKRSSSSCFVGDELFFGVDHLPQLERALSKEPA